MDNTSRISLKAIKASTISVKAAILACREASDELTRQAELAAAEGYYFVAELLAQESIELDKIIYQLQEECAKISLKLFPCRNYISGKE